MHLPGIPELKEQKRLERAAAWRRREAIKEMLRAYRREHGTEAYIKARLSGHLRSPDPTVRRITKWPSDG